MAGQTQPLVRVTGIVHSTKVVSYEGGVNKRTQKPYDGGSYGEVVVMTEKSRLGGDVVDMPAVLTFRTDTSDLASFGAGQVVDVLVTVFCDLINASGNWFNVPGYRYACAVETPAAAGSRSRASEGAGV